MRINSAPFRSRQCQDRLSLFDIRYALLCCMSYTDQTKKLDEMLSYVLVCSFEIARRCNATEHILDIIDHMTKIIGGDYKDDTAYVPACPVPEQFMACPVPERFMVCIFAKLDSISRHTLYTNMTTPGLITEPADLALAKSQLSNLLDSFDNNMLITTGNANSFLAGLNKHLQQRLNEIVIQMVRTKYSV